MRNGITFNHVMEGVGLLEGNFPAVNVRRAEVGGETFNCKRQVVGKKTHPGWNDICQYPIHSGIGLVLAPSRGPWTWGCQNQEFQILDPGWPAE